MRKPSAKTLKEKATRLHSQIVRARGSCESCGETDYAVLQCAHIVSRNYAATRCSPENAFCLCARCHWHYTLWPIEFGNFTIDKIGAEKYDELKQRAQAGVKTNSDYWQSWVDQLTQIKKDLFTD